MDIVQIAEKLATEYHAGQFRHDKVTPYIEHLKAVAKIAREKYKNFVSEMYLPETIIVALFHDSAEEANIPEIEIIRQLKRYYQLNSLNPPLDYKEIQLSLTLLNKNYSENYLEYILKIQQDNIATVVKLSDLEHNISDLKEGSLKDKYRLSKYILEH